LDDGATWIRNMVEEYFPDAQQILDFFHLSENVHTYAKYLFKMDAAKDKKPNGCPINLHGYILNNINNIDYAAYEGKGYFIGSGAIESGNKIILQDRLKRAGMRWNTQTAQAILTLKSKAESGLWHRDVEVPFLKHCFEYLLNI